MKLRGHYTLLLIALCGLMVNVSVGMGMGPVQETERSPASAATPGRTAGARGGNFTMESVTLSGGGGVLPDGSVLGIGQPFAGTMSSENYTMEVGSVPALTSCVITGLCDDGQECTADACDPGNPESEADGCVHEYQVQVYADICLPYDPPDGPQPNLDDILCELDDFADGPGVDGCTCNGFRKTTDLHPCPEDSGGDASIGLDDILKMLDAFAGQSPCDDPCPG